MHSNRDLKCTDVSAGPPDKINALSPDESPSSPPPIYVLVLAVFKIEPDNY